MEQHLSGWYAFVHEPWHFPILKIFLLNYPEGASLSITDSIPLFALFFKPLLPLLPNGFNYFSIFLVFSYCFQAVSALVLAYSLNKNNILGVLSLVGFSLAMPFLTYLIGRGDTIMPEGFILLGLAGYFFVASQRLKLWSCHAFFGLLILSSLLMHPYLTAMFYPFYLISVLRLKKDGALPWSAVLKPVLALHGLVLAECVICGIGQTGELCGFGLYSMNLLAPVYGGWLTHDQYLVSSGRSEVFAYMGLGLVLLICIALFLQRKRLTLLFKQYRALCWVGVGFFVYSIYGALYFGSHPLLIYGVPHFFLTCDFRVSGRFFYPLAYMLMTFSVVSVLNKRPKLAVFVLPFLLLIQFAEDAFYFKSAEETLQTMYTPLPITNPNSIEIAHWIAEAKIVVFYPKNSCPTMQGLELQTLTDLQLASAKQDVPINSAYLAHFRSPSCGDDAHAFPHLNPKLLVSTVETPSPTIVQLLKQDPAVCKTLGQVYYCTFRDN